MALEKQTTVDKVEVIKDGCVQVRTSILIVEDGNIISRTYHRHVVAPGDDFSNEDDRVRAVCASVHTAEVIAAYRASTQALELGGQ